MDRQDRMRQVEIFIGSACTGNPGNGGWSVILRFGAHEKILSGGEPDTTRNQMELTATIRGLRALIEPCELTLTTQSRYVADGLPKWLQGWTPKGWKSASQRPVRNLELWHDLIPATQRHTIRWNIVPAETDHPDCARAERMAREAGAR